MMGKYDYLKEYIYPASLQSDPAINITLSCITKMDKECIATMKERCGWGFPASLIEFWNEIGQGILGGCKNGFNKLDGGDNEILSPQIIRSAILTAQYDDYDKYAEETDYDDFHGIIIDSDGEEMILAKGYFPFFCISDSSHLLWMKVGEDGVYDFCERKLEDRLEDFIYNLYHIHPDYYDKLDYTPSTWQEMLEKEREDIENGVEFAREYYIAIEKYWHLGRHNRSNKGLFSSTDKPSI